MNDLAGGFWARAALCEPVIVLTFPVFHSLKDPLQVPEPLRSTQPQRYVLEHAPFYSSL